MNGLDTRVRARLYVRIDEETGLAYEDQAMTEEDARDINEKLAADGEPFRWRAYAERAGDAVAA